MKNRPSPKSWHAWLLIGVLSTGCAAAPVEQPEIGQVADLLDDWHAAASLADEQRYFDHFAPEGIFLGTDAGERWTVEEFRAYAHPHFSVGRGWTYVPRDRHVMFSADRQLAWFDELLDNEKYGTLRGSGVLRLTPQGWKLVHYQMAFMVPNERTARVVEAIGDGEPGSER